MAVSGPATNATRSPCTLRVSGEKTSRGGRRVGYVRSATRSRVSRPSLRRLLERLPRSTRVIQRRPRGPRERSVTLVGAYLGVSHVPHSTVPSRPHATSVAGESQQDSQMVFMVCRRRGGWERAEECCGGRETLAFPVIFVGMTWPPHDRLRIHGLWFQKKRSHVSRKTFEKEHIRRPPSSFRRDARRDVLIHTLKNVLPTPTGT